MENQPYFQVKKSHCSFNIVKCNGSKFEYEGRKYKYWGRKLFKQQEARATCSFLNGISNIKKTKKKDYDIFGFKKKSKKIERLEVIF